MAQQSKREYLQSLDVRYRQSRRAEKQRILDEFMRVCGDHRKYAIGLLNRPLPGPRPRRVRKRRPRYSAAVIDVLSELWTASGYLCAVRLKAALPTWLPWLRRRLALSPAQERQLLAISPRQIERRLRAPKQRVKRRVYGTTRPGSLLKHMIPIQTEPWDVTKAGYLEIDLVSHAGANADGEYLYTLDAVDIHTGWVERQAVRGKGHQGMVAALEAIARQLPFALRGIDSDNGSEFINNHLWAFCQRAQPPIRFTRSRPYKKDDNAHIEQKNGTPVRKLVGWDRYESPAALAALQALYADLRLFQNLFQPSMKLRHKSRHGSRLLRRYDTPQTPFTRVLACAEADRLKVAALRRVLARTDPFALSQRIDTQLEQVWQLAHRVTRQPRATKAKVAQPRAVTPWRDWIFSDRLKQQHLAQRRTASVAR
ncbi:MAG: integrase [Nitrospiraceae bacterium]